MAWSKEITGYCRVNRKPCVDTHELGLEQEGDVICSIVEGFLEENPNLSG